MKVIELTRGCVAVVDDEDFLALAQYRWQVSIVNGYTCYAVRSGPRINGKQKFIRMHREILGAPEGIDVDHINGNGLDNRRQNLRLATKSQNQANKKPGKNSLTKLKGVGFVPARKKFRARLRGISLGHFETAEAAKNAYDNAAQELFGAFARLN